MAGLVPGISTSLSGLAMPPKAMPIGKDWRKWADVFFLLLYLYTVYPAEAICFP